MRLVKNHGTRATRTHHQDTSQEASAVNTTPPDAELDELFSFHDDPDFLVGSAQGRAELRQLILSSPMPEASGSVVGSGTTAAAKTGGVETTAHAILSTRPRRLILPQPWAKWILVGAAASLTAIAVIFGILGNAPQGTKPTGPSAAMPKIPLNLSESEKLHLYRESELQWLRAAQGAHRETFTDLSIRFAANPATLAPSDDAYVRALAASLSSVLSDHPALKVVLIGCDADTSYSALSEEPEMSSAHVRTVASALTTAGVPAERMVVNADFSKTETGVSNESLAAVGLAAQTGCVDIIVRK
jgi:hypothetical protein